MLIPKLVGEKLIKLKVSNPAKLENIIRSAAQLDEYKWIKEKYIIRVKNNELWFDPKQMIIETVEEPAVTINDADFYLIINTLLLQEHTNINFVRPVFEDDELDKIKSWADKNGYSITYDNETLKVKKNG